MEPLNNDMDDLFKKAGDLYPLRTTESDWDAVFGKLKGENLGGENSVSSQTVRSSRFKRRWLLLLLLIPVGMGSVAYFSNAKTFSSASQKTPFAHAEPTRVNITHPIISDSTKQIISDQTKQGAAAVNQSINNLVLTKRKKADHSSIHDNTNLSAIRNKVVPGAFPFSLATASDVLKMKPIYIDIDSRNKKINLDLKGPPADSLLTAAIVKKKDLTTKTNKGFYVGLLVGPDLSSIKFQSVKQFGFGLGVLVGYRFNNRLSIESGLLWDKKYYYTKGEYFNKSKTMMPATEDVLNLNGYCNMFEIPLDLRYDFNKNARHEFFVKTGFSAYLMKKEMYDILAKNNGMTVAYPATYYNTSNSFLAIVQVSAGYEQVLSDKTKIQVEPYLKIPIKGIGIGSMPISSAGFYIGITHSFR